LPNLGRFTVGKESTLKANQCGSKSETLLLSLQICGVAICGLGHQANLWIDHYKFADLQFVDWRTSEFCSFAIVE
jgi:hypothetical protein